MPGTPFAHETTGGSSPAHGRANHLFHPSLSRGDVGVPGPRTEASGRRDIDAAMLEALQRAMTSDDGLSGVVRADPDRDERLDIDAAMLEALRQATIAHPGARDG